MEERLIQLETKISYQESVIADLNETVISQQKEIDRLVNAVALLKLKVEELRELTGEDIPNNPPPHY